MITQQRHPDPSSGEIIPSRLTSARLPDTTFEGDGFVISGSAEPRSRISAAAISPDGKLVAAGRAVPDAQSTDDFAIDVLNYSGVAYVISIAGDGSIYLRLTSSGAINSSFGNNSGEFTFSTSGSSDACRGTWVDTDQKCGAE